MHRFFLPGMQPGDKEVWIEADDAFHIASVLRLRPGDEVLVCDGAANDAVCVLTAVGKNGVAAKIKEQRRNFAESDIEIVLFQALPKSDKMDTVIQKCVELGVTKIVPLITEFTVARPGKSAHKIARFQKIAETAAKQSGRGIVPTVGSLISLTEALPLFAGLSAVAVAYERETETGLKGFLRTFQGESLGLVVGPEGGFSESEIALLRAHRVVPVTMGRRILRTETAGPALLAMVGYALDL